jgi:hypothetical protein
MGGEASNIGGKPWEKAGQDMGKYRKIMGKIWENHGKNMGIS